MNYNLIEEWKKYDTDEYLYHRYFHQYLLHPYEKPKGEEYVTLISLINFLETNFRFNLSTLADFWVNYMLHNDLVHYEYYKDRDGKWIGRYKEESEEMNIPTDLAITTDNYIRTPLADILFLEPGKNSSIQCRYVNLFGPFIVKVYQNGCTDGEIEIYDKLMKVPKNTPMGEVVRDLVNLSVSLTNAFAKKEELNIENTDHLITTTQIKYYWSNDETK